MSSNHLVPPPLLQQTARRFKLLGEPHRLQLLNFLNQHGEMTVQALVEATGQTQANVSKHLRLLLDQGMVARRQEGLYAHYSIADATLNALCLLMYNRVTQDRARLAADVA